MGRYSPASTRHNVSNTWLLTKRSAVRILFGEPNISHFEILSGLLVNSGWLRLAENAQYCGKAVLSRLAQCPGASPESPRAAHFSFASHSLWRDVHVWLTQIF